MSQVDIQGMPLWCSFSVCQTLDHAAAKAVDLLETLDKKPNSFFLGCLLDGEPKTLTPEQRLKHAFARLVGARAALYELDHRALSLDAAAFFALVTLPEPDPVQLKKLTLFASDADPTVAKISLAEKTSKPAGFSEVWSVRVVDVGKSWKQTLFPEIEGASVDLKRFSPSQLKARALCHESQLKIRCYCGRLLRCDAEEAFAHLCMNQCASVSLKDCQLKKCGERHAPDCLETDWVCSLCSAKLRLRDSVAHERQCSELWFSTCWVCGEKNKSFSEACRHSCFTALKSAMSRAKAAEAGVKDGGAVRLKYDFLDVDAVAKSELGVLKAAIDGLCRFRQAHEALAPQKNAQAQACETEKYAIMQFANKKHVGYERFADAKPYLVPSHGKHELITKPRPDGVHRVPRYLLIESVEELIEASDYTDHSIAIKPKFKHIVSAPEFGILNKMKHHIEVMGCGLRDVSVFAGATHALDLRDNEIEDVSPLANVGSNLFLSRNRVRDASALRCRCNLFLDHNQIADASALSGVSVLDLRGNPLQDPQAVCSRNQSVLVD